LTEAEVYCTPSRDFETGAFKEPVLVICARTLESEVRTRFCADIICISKQCERHLLGEGSFRSKQNCAFTSLFRGLDQRKFGADKD
jgi:hypothetical protein